MADVSKSLHGVDLRSPDGKTKDTATILFSDLLAKEGMGKDPVEGPIIEPIMVKNLTGKKCVYYFEGGSHHLLEVVENDTEALMPEKAQEFELLFKKIWREVFSIVRIFVSFFVLFAVEAIFYATHYVVQPLVLNSVSMVGNHVLKPTLIDVFNNLVQPITAFVWNVLNAVSSGVKPLVDLVALILKQVAMLLQSIRLFNVTYNYTGNTPNQKEEVETV